MNARKEADRQLALLEQGTAEIVPHNAFRDRLERSIRTGIPLRVKLGIDPTARNIHLGHMVPYRKLRQFQDLGHQAVIIIGDYTAAIGDPSGRNTARPALSFEEVHRNAELYAEQIFKVVDWDRAEIRQQSEWYTHFGLADVLSLSGSFSLAQLLAHETFRNRLGAGERVGLDELLYPLLQAFDSVAVRADIEIGGTDQKFNILSGRDLQRIRGLESQCAVLVPLLPGLDGRKMSKSLGNDIPVACGASEQFARLMSVSDAHIRTYQELVLLDPAEVCDETDLRLSAGENPRDIKLELARRIVDTLNGADSGTIACREWLRRFSERKTPSEIPTHTVSDTIELAAALRGSGLTRSSGEARRLISEGAVYIDEVRVSDPTLRIDASTLHSTGCVVRIGRRRYVRLLPPGYNGEH